MRHMAFVWAVFASMAFGFCWASVPAAEPTSRRPANDDALRFWLDNRLVHDRYSIDEVTAATGLSKDEIGTAIKRVGVNPDSKPRRAADAPLTLLPYPGGRHPRIGFLEGAIDPQRETKL